MGFIAFGGQDYQLEYNISRLPTWLVRRLHRGRSLILRRLEFHQLGVSPTLAFAAANQHSQHTPNGHALRTCQTLCWWVQMMYWTQTKPANAPYDLYPLNEVRFVLEYQPLIHLGWDCWQSPTCAMQAPYFWGSMDPRSLLVGVMKSLNQRCYVAWLHLVHPCL